MNTGIVVTVSQFLDAVNLALGSADEYEIQGEVCEFKKGKWISFSLKDSEDGSLLRCVMGEWTWRRIGIELADGMLVKITGSAKVNKKYGSFGMWVETVEPIGQGSLKIAYDLLVKKLREEGLFARKRVLPEFIERIGVISSKHGVVIHDFMNNLLKLGLAISFVDSRVEGDGAVEGIVKALRILQSEKLRLDAIVIIRGGGSLESLQAFNNELVARAIFASNIPVIAGIGHDVDVPIACMVADVSCSTPTAAAHVMNQSWQALNEGVPQLERNLFDGYENLLISFKHTLMFKNQTLVACLDTMFHYSDRLAGALQHALEGIALRIKQTVTMLHDYERHLAAVNPERNLALGYSIVRNVRGRIVKRVRDVGAGESMTTQVSDGTIHSIAQHEK